MQDVLFSGSVTDLEALITACGFPDSALALTERLPQQIVTEEERRDLLQFVSLKALLNNKNHLARATSGRAFSRDAELRWQQEKGQTHAVYLGKPCTLSKLKQDQETLTTLELAKEPKSYYLFGEYLDLAKYPNMQLLQEPDHDYYAEVRIPRLLLYPRQNKARRVQVQVQEYLNKVTGRVELFRFQDLKPEG
jgi:hypothetical protein